AAAFAVSTAAPASVASVTVTPSPVSLAVGSTQQLTATLRDASGNVLTGRVVSWSSSNLPAATVSTNGLVTGAAGGSATITATSEGKQGTGARSEERRVGKECRGRGWAVAGGKDKSETVCCTEVNEGEGQSGSYEER